MIPNPTMKPKTALEIAQRAVTDILHERKRQDDKWGVQNHDPFMWLAILTEETGEAARDALSWKFAPNNPRHPGCGSTEEFIRFCLDNYRREMVQVAAVAMAAVESFDRQQEQQSQDAATPDPQTVVCSICGSTFNPNDPAALHVETILGGISRCSKCLQKEANP